MPRGDHSRLVSYAPTILVVACLLTPVPAVHTTDPFGRGSARTWFVPTYLPPFGSRLLMSRWIQRHYKRHG